MPIVDAEVLSRTPIVDAEVVKVGKGVSHRVQPIVANRVECAALTRLAIIEEREELISRLISVDIPVNAVPGSTMRVDVPDEYKNSNFSSI